MEELLEKNIEEEVKSDNFSFSIEKNILLNGLKIVERATAQSGLQPILSNILIKGVDKNKIFLYGTNFDLTISTQIEAMVKNFGEITLPVKKLLEIVSRIDEGIIDFELKETIMTITNKKSIFEINGISASEFQQSETIKDEENEIEIELKPFIDGLKDVSFAAATYESNNSLLSGVVCDISKNVLEMAATDGNRLARTKKIIKNKDDKAQKIIIPAKIMQEFLRISSFIEEDTIKLYVSQNKVMIKSENIKMITTVLNGQYPQYNQLIPQTFTKEAKINVSKLITAIERVSPMVNEKTMSEKFLFFENKLLIKADTSDKGKAEEEIDIIYNKEEMTIAFNYRFLLDFLKTTRAEDVIACMNSNLSAVLLKPDNEEDNIYIIMPLNIR